MAIMLFPRDKPTQEGSREAEVVRVAGAFLALAALGLTARLTSKAMVRMALQVDDYLLIWAFVGLFCCS